ncbi:hypothetical protein DICPUDRAFT_85543 [Dictyostelium purpureum]|uniref:Uncharacterized protein n=1 Tax=Dictyostelium purpureum TaxID=5786 RepID=F1A624_DICPU|nr:uncharacterized protein DICPUDRAFT_85543 [Dictyostelium purpureum]EGC28354.1 hypothetical protein DICPUDRAFT_85543 [Dictyostelium purpureum]|eukprot:XP_003295118.1 hypothetical protein DICPUDRAFT_85543 [Dictyostelium purpureum]
MVTNFTYECSDNYKSMENYTVKNFKGREFDFSVAYLDVLSLKLGNIYDLANQVEERIKKMLGYFNSIITEIENLELVENTEKIKEIRKFKLFLNNYKLFLKLIGVFSYDIKRKCRNRFQNYNEIIISILKSIKEKSEIIIYLVEKLKFIIKLPSETNKPPLTIKNSVNKKYSMISLKFQS